MSKRPILKVAVNVPLSREFDYLPPAGGPAPAIGQRVRVPFGRRQQVGMVVGQRALAGRQVGLLQRTRAGVRPGRGTL